LAIRAFVVTAQPSLSPVIAQARAPEAISATLYRDGFAASQLRPLCSLRSELALSAAQGRLAATVIVVKGERWG